MIKHSEAKKKIHILVDKFEKAKEHYRASSFNETQVRNEFLDPFFEALGWDIRNIAGKSTTEREVLLEESLKADIYAHTKKPDYTFRLYGERRFFVEAKKPCVHIEHENEPARQVRRYGYTAGLKISVLTNFEYLYIYDTSYPVEKEDSRTKAIVREYHYTEYEDAVEVLLELLGKESVYTGRFDEAWSQIEGKKQNKSVDQLFLRQINDWRLLLGREIHIALPDISIDYLGDVVQSYINKILFLRVCEDRNIETYRTLLRIADRKSHAELITKFKDADRKYNSGLFDELLSERVIGDISSSFWVIIRQLYYPDCPYSFAVLSSDILGKIYEIFLAQRLDLVNGELRIVNKQENAERDIVTTPNFIVREILRQTVSVVCPSLDVHGLFSLKCADIACGSGVFLLELYQLLYDYLVDWYVNNDITQLIQTGEHTYKLPFDKKCEIMTRCIFGVDKDFNAVEACRFGLLLKLLEDEDVNTLSSLHPVLPDLSNNIFYGNSLLSQADVPTELAEKINPFDFNNRKFDVIVGNPPYMKTEDIKKLTPDEKRLYEQSGLYKSAYRQYDKYFLFIERAIALLKEGGYLGYIVPNKFMKVNAARELRRIISAGKYLKSITSFGAHPVFEDKSTYSCILILQKKENTNFSYSEIDNLAEWRVRGKNGICFSLRNSSDLSENTWVLCSDRHQVLLDKILLQSKPLGEVVGPQNIFNGIQTSATNIYVFVPQSEDRDTYTFKAFNGKSYRIEKAVTKPYFKTVHGDDSLNTYRAFTPNARVIFPYKTKAGRSKILSLNTIHSKYPLLYSFLQDAKAELDKPSRDIQPAPVNDNEWHRYGRHQSLEACGVKEKIIVGVLSQSDKYAIDRNGTFVSSGGTAGYCLISVPTDNQYSIYYIIQAILNSLQGEWFASLYGEIFRGGYIARGTKVLKQVPIPTIDFDKAEDKTMHDTIASRQKALIKLGDKIALSKSNPRKQVPLLRQFESLKTKQQESINALYQMSETEASLIPVIKEIYAAD